MFSRVSCGSCSADNARLIDPSRPVVRQHARIGETQEPCGTPVFISTISSLLPSRQTTVRRSRRNEFTHLTMGRGTFNSRRRLSRTGWDTLLKNPDMSNVRRDDVIWRFRDDSMSCRIAREISSADLPLNPPNWYGDIKSFFSRWYAIRRACIRSITLPKTSKSWMGLYAFGIE